MAQKICVFRTGNSSAIASAMKLIARIIGAIGAPPSARTIASSSFVWQSRPLSFWLTEIRVASATKRSIFDSLFVCPEPFLVSFLSRNRSKIRFFTGLRAQKALDALHQEILQRTVAPAQLAVDAGCVVLLGPEPASMRLEKLRRRAFQPTIETAG